MNETITTSIRLKKELLSKIDSIANYSHRSRAWIIKQALGYYLEERDDLDLALNKLQDPNSSYVDWETAKNELLN
jgi:RHH-type transcriptional regulator, rel operon repressor / antitoxin RelB